CPADGCGVPAEKPYSQVKKNWSRADNGPFCSRECSGVMSHKDPIGRTPGEVFERILLEHPPSVVETHGVDPNFVPHYPRAERIYSEDPRAKRARDVRKQIGYSPAPIYKCVIC